MGLHRQVHSLSCPAVLETEREITVRPMAEKDLDAVLAIETASFSHPWTKRHFLDELESRHGFPFVAVCASGEVAGYLCLKVVLDEGEILDVAVDKVFRRRGVGRLLVTHVLEKCADAGAAFLALEVRVGNVAAQELYRSLGFQETGRRKRYYQDGEDAVLMAYDFGRAAQ